jgi:hypothetical protein
MSKTTNAVMMNNGDDMSPGTGWTWAAAVDAMSEHNREARLFGSPTDRTLARHGEGSSSKRSARSKRRGDAKIPGTGWTWADAVDAAKEHERDVRANPDPVDRVLARLDAEPVDLGDEVSAEALELAAEVEAEHRLHPRAIDRIMHRHGECACFAR